MAKRVDWMVKEILVTMDDERRVIARGAVAIDGDRMPLSARRMTSRGGSPPTGSPRGSS
jgi:hypothetical protein